LPGPSAITPFNRVEAGHAVDIQAGRTPGAAGIADWVEIAAEQCPPASDSPDFQAFQGNFELYQAN
jgi:hypothetical protein